MLALDDWIQIGAAYGAQTAYHGSHDLTTIVVQPWDQNGLTAQ